MLSKILNGLLIVLIIGLIANYVYRLPKYSDGEVAPAISAQLIDGSKFELKDLKGKYALLDFWGSWCAPCRRENKKVVALKKEFENATFSDASGFEVVSIAIETNENAWKKAIQGDGLYWKYHIAQLQRFKSPIAKDYGIKEIPTKYLVGPDGNILSVNASFESITKLLQSKRK